MKMRLVREQYRAGSTIGRLFVDDAEECFTLEDGIRTNKVMKETAIPPGTYPVKVTKSNHPSFRGQDLPLLENVPNFVGIRIHTGNNAANTEGCILVGRRWTPGRETIEESRAAFAPLFAKIQSALGRGDPVSIEVVQENAPPEFAKRAFRPAGVKARAKPRKKVPARSKKAAGSKRVGTRPKRLAKKRAASKRKR